MPPYAGSEGEFPVADDLSRRGLNLPSGFTLTGDDIERVCAALRELL
jgi:dTDP-4-amino-4,6-dideoxygalactose transaminase